MVYYWLIRGATPESRAELDAQFAAAGLAEHTAAARRRARWDTPTPEPVPPTGTGGWQPGRLPAPPPWWNPAANTPVLARANAGALGVTPGRGSTRTAPAGSAGGRR